MRLILKNIYFIQQLIAAICSIKESNEKNQRDKSYLTEDISKKNQMIDSMRVKLHRYEFSLKEAILFLSKPMEAYESWLNTRSDATGASANGASNHLLNAVSGAVAAANSTNVSISAIPPSRVDLKQNDSIRSRAGSAVNSQSTVKSSSLKDGKLTGPFFLFVYQILNQFQPKKNSYVGSCSKSTKARFNKS
jgi:hypothetical protein